MIFYKYAPKQSNPEVQRNSVLETVPYVTQHRHRMAAYLGLQAELDKNMTPTKTPAAAALW